MTSACRLLDVIDHGGGGGEGAEAKNGVERAAKRAKPGEEERRFSIVFLQNSDLSSCGGPSKPRPVRTVVPER